MLPGAGTIAFFYWLRLGALAGLVVFASVRARRRWQSAAPDDMAKRILLPGGGGR